ncbi:MAG TPA: cob(I)yrinic acid a,c-diamide adenosyltransferase [Chloroflexota bacterium]|nr:cob(I)yrinic acid a,c-diamide adenosyltransferase [Chloroflexota bacterium]
MTTEDKPKARTKGLVMVFTGNGKGKTTAALGMAFRSAGHRYQVAVIQFIKGTMRTGEEEAAKALAPYIDWTVTGHGFTAGPWNVATPEEHRQAAQEALRITREKMLSGQYRMVVMDEVLGAVKAGLVSIQQILELIEEKPPRLNLVLTGRDAPQEIIDAADLATEMRLIKHPYDQGIAAQKGVEF